MALERRVNTLLSRMTLLFGAALTTFTLSCNEDNKLSMPEQYCSIPANHQKQEICGNRFDDNCNGEIDEGCNNSNRPYCEPGNKISEEGVRCQEKTKGLDVSGNARCQAGTYICQNERVVCVGEIGPISEKCNDFDDDCDREKENILTGALDCYADDKRELPLDHPSIFPVEIGSCRKGQELCIDGVSGGMCYFASLPQEEAKNCDCNDSDCNRIIDDGADLTPLEILAVLDNSQSMGYQDPVTGIIPFDKAKEDYTSFQALPCAEEKTKISTAVVGTSTSSEFWARPGVKRRFLSPQEFRDSLAADFPEDNGPTLEPSLTVLLYAACAALEADGKQNQSCKLIKPYNVFRGLFNAGTNRKVILVTDEHAQGSYLVVNGSPLVFNQEQVARIVEEAGLQLIIYTNPIYDNLVTDPTGLLQGFGYFIQRGAELRDIYHSDFGRDMEDLLNNSYCNGLTITSTRSD